MLGIACAFFGLLVASFAEDGDKVRRFLSRSGKLEFEVRNQAELWYSRVGQPATRRLLFREENGLLMEAICSVDDRLIVAGWGGASAGHDLELFVRQKSGRYVKLKVNLAGDVWRAVWKAQKLPKDASPAHVHCFAVAIRTRPLAVLLRVHGNYLAEGKGQTGFEDAYLRYTVDTDQLTIIPKPPEATALEQADE